MSFSTPPLDRQFVLVTGAARSGKSEWAEHLANRSSKQITYVATAQIDSEDLEWQARIARHQARRPQHWRVAIAPTNLAKTIADGSVQDCLLIDSLGTWLANHLEQSAEEWHHTQQDLVMTMQRSVSDLIVVAEEVGWGVVPAYPLGRLFRDRLGELVRCLAAIAHPVYLVAGGHVLNLSQLGTPLNLSLDSEYD